MTPELKTALEALLAQVVKAHPDGYIHGMAVGVREMVAALSAEPREGEAADRLSPYNAVARAMDMASLLAGSVAQNDTHGAEHYACLLRSHLVDYIYPVQPLKPAAPEGSEFDITLEGLPCKTLLNFLAPDPETGECSPLRLQFG